VGEGGDTESREIAPELLVLGGADPYGNVLPRGRRRGGRR